MTDENLKRLISLAENLLIYCERQDSTAISQTASDLRAFINSLPKDMREDHHGLRPKLVNLEFSM